jgi:DNA-binding winged helix-turn-helix (wHTH) protein
VHFGAFDLDEANALLLRDGKPVAIAPTPFAVLCALARDPGSLLTKHRLLDEVWGHQFVSDSVLKTAISDLRAVLGDDPRQPRIIETVTRRGYRFIAVLAPTAAASGPAISGAAERVFVGRASELAQLERAWNGACSGKRAIVWIAGEPGIGKTELIEQFIGKLGDVAVARGHSVEHFGAGEPYLPVLEALAGLCRTDSAAAQMLRAVAPAWLLQLPWLCTAEERAELRMELAGAGPDRMLREMAELLDRLTQDRPLLLVIEDLHWSDRGTIQLIDYVARRSGSARLMWLGSFRLAEVVALDHPLNGVRHELRMHGLCEEIVLDPFSETEIAACVATWSRALAADESFVRALQLRTDGVPLFVKSVMREVIANAAEGGDEFASAARLAGVALPANVAGIVDRYIARLEPYQHELLTAAAVCGSGFRVTTLAHVLERDAPSTEQTCEALAREQLWLSAPSAATNNSLEPMYGFSHALFRQVLYERTTPLRRARLHAVVGATLELERAAGMPVTAAELAMHFERGREPMVALRYYVEAAEAALLHLSPAECFDYTGQAAQLLARTAAGTDRDALELALATLRGVAAVHVLGLGDETRSAFSRGYVLLQDMPQHPLRELLLHGYGWLLCLRAEYAEALAVAGRAELLTAGAGDPAMVVAACTVHGLVHFHLGDPLAARSWIERGLAAIETYDTRPGQSFAADPKVTLLAMLGLQLLHLGLVQQGRARLDEAKERAHRLGQPMACLVAIWYEALFTQRLGDSERLALLADEMHALVDRFSLAQGRTAWGLFRGWADTRAGSPRQGYERIRTAYQDNARLGMLLGASESRGYAAEALLRAGDAEAAQAELEQALDVTNRYEERVYLPQLLLTAAAIARACGRAAEVEPAIRRALEESRRQRAPWLELLTLVELGESACAAAEDIGSLAGLLDRLPEAAETVLVARARAILGQ